MDQQPGRKKSIRVKFNVGVQFGGLTEKTPFLYRYFEVLGQKISCQLICTLSPRTNFVILKYEFVLTKDIDRVTFVNPQSSACILERAFAAKKNKVIKKATIHSGYSAPPTLLLNLSFPLSPELAGSMAPAVLPPAFNLTRPPVLPPNLSLALPPNLLGLLVVLYVPVVLLAVLGSILVILSVVR